MLHCSFLVCCDLPVGFERVVVQADEQQARLLHVRAALYVHCVPGFSQKQSSDVMIFLHLVSPPLAEGETGPAVRVQI